ncbi:hypothetical protein QA635_08585 [Bradyrhizobium brasilense]|uniref:hypothetical protein n=1 Tax=Bradyrhizobium brasilense TaxID=1419277 RepID=UPI0024B17D90|nr:hypothetical protein [Bradyrhizobium australafricanum]WFU34454.1 hypothetical protein QA635_08585 [Bradyrhizobium australafricanum]
MTSKRRRFKQTQSLEERLADEAMRLRSQAKALPPSAKKEALIRKARQDETAAHLTDWLMSSGLRAPI